MHDKPILWLSLSVVDFYFRVTIDDQMGRNIYTIFIQSPGV